MWNTKKTRNSLKQENRLRQTEIRGENIMYVADKLFPEFAAV